MKKNIIFLTIAILFILTVILSHWFYKNQKSYTYTFEYECNLYDTNPYGDTLIMVYVPNGNEHFKCNRECQVTIKKYHVQSFKRILTDKEIDDYKIALEMIYEDDLNKNTPLFNCLIDVRVGNHFIIEDHFCEKAIYPNQDSVLNIF